MTVRTIAPHRHAIADVHDIICYYRELAGTAVAENFAIEIDEACARLRQHPNIGSPRPALELDIEGIKSWALKRFPHQIFYEIQIGIEHPQVLVNSPSFNIIRTYHPFGVGIL